MEQYISKNAVVAEIEKRIKINKECMLGLRNLDYYQGKVDALSDAISFIKNLERKEVDLLTELSNYIEHYRNRETGYTLFGIAKHFFELGLKTKQESNDEVKIGETQIYLEDDGGEPPYEGKQWLDLSCMEYEIPKALFKDGDNVEILIRKTRKGKNI